MFNLALVVHNRHEASNDCTRMFIRARVTVRHSCGCWANRLSTIRGSSKMLTDPSYIAFISAAECDQHLSLV